MTRFYKTLSLSLCALILLLATTHLVYAQDTNVGANATTQVQSGAASQASNAGNSQQAIFNTPDKQSFDYNQHGHETLYSQAPLSLGGAAAGFSNENCANTTQGALTLPWFGLAKGNALESIRCNARRDAGVWVALADDARSHGETRQNEQSLRRMAWWSKCMATKAEEQACKILHLIPSNDTMEVSPDQDNISQRATIPHRPEGWTNAAIAERK